MTESSFKRRDGTETPGMSGSSTVTVAAGKDGGLRLISSDVQMPDLGPGAPEPLKAALDVLAKSSPVALVRADGTYAGLEDPAALDAMATTLLASFEPQLAEIPDEGFRTAMTRMIGQLFSPETLAREGDASWNGPIGQWLGTSFDLGVPVSWTQELENGLGQPLAGTGTTTAEAWEACHDGKRAPMCLRLHTHIDLDVAGLTGQIDDLVLRPFRQLAADRGLPIETRVTAAAVDVVVLLEPRTLRPWHYVEDRSNSFEVTLGGPEPETSTTTSGKRTVRTWTWR